MSSSITEPNPAIDCLIRLDTVLGLVAADVLAAEPSHELVRALSGCGAPVQALDSAIDFLLSQLLAEQLEAIGSATAIARELLIEYYWPEGSIPKDLIPDRLLLAGNDGAAVAAVLLETLGRSNDVEALADTITGTPSLLLAAWLATRFGDWERAASWAGLASTKGTGSDSFYRTLLTGLTSDAREALEGPRWAEAASILEHTSGQTSPEQVWLQLAEAAIIHRDVERGRKYLSLLAEAASAGGRAGRAVELRRLVLELEPRDLEARRELIAACRVSGFVEEAVWHEQLLSRYERLIERG